MPKISVEDKVLELLHSKQWVSSEEIEKAFPPKAPGHFSWPQRLRGLRDKGYTVERRIKEGTKNLSEWHLTASPTIALERAETAQGSEIAPKIGIRTGKPLLPQIGLSVPNINPPPVGARPAFITQSGQFSFIG